MSYIQTILDFVPQTKQEYSDQQQMLDYIALFPTNILSRTNKLAHFTSSNMIFHSDFTKVLMVYHKIYQSWSWTGGHVDDCHDFFFVARKEAEEETSITDLIPLSKSPVSLEILPVWGHQKNQHYVNAHLHLNLTYAWIGDESKPLKEKADENSAVSWIPIADLPDWVTERDMLPVYQKIIERVLLAVNKTP